MPSGCGDTPREEEEPPLRDGCMDRCWASKRQEELKMNINQGS